MPEIRLPGQPGDPEFEAAYEKATQGQGLKAAIIDLPGRALPKTFGHAARRLEATMEWLDFDEATQRKNARLIERFLRMQVDPACPLTWRDTPVEHLDADHLRSIIESVFAANRTVAKHLLVAIKKLLWVGIEIEKWIKPQNESSLSIHVRIPNRPPIPRGGSPFGKSSRRAIRLAPRPAPATRSRSGSATVEAISPRWNGTIWFSRRSNCSTGL
ncbi:MULTISPECIES: hypothetical protein [unclassified Mesorhizobium]|uniref:hypothetical protein n=1 Tax=unclassified Mesorhizobium TaxID=325217 RepID=UPI001FD93854|nr:hypothetical protein [Mesorhizobium sp. L2C084A000]